MEIGYLTKEEILQAETYTGRISIKTLPTRACGELLAHCVAKSHVSSLRFYCVGRNAAQLFVLDRNRG
jgi:hypothetical protein